MRSNKSLYPDILFHFTSKENLWKILRNTFLVSYSREKIVGGKTSIEFYTPMVSFCDLRISELKDHMEKYGNYGIGLTKDWANKNGLNPVFYVNKSSPFTRNYIRSMKNMEQHVEKVPGLIGKIMAESSYVDILSTYNYIKNYEGDLKRKKGTITKNYRFADEREWRFVPTANSKIPAMIPTTQFEEKEEEYKKLASTEKLKFEPEDIKYIIIEKDNEIIELSKLLEEVKSRFNPSTKKRLLSRILTVEQINNDI